MARDHGIVTPYTSYLILEDERRRNVPMHQQTMRELDADGLARDEAKAVFDSAARGSEGLEVAGRRAVDNAMNAGSLRSASAEQQAKQDYGLAKRNAAELGRATVRLGVDGVPATQPTGYRFASNYAQQSRVVNGRAFYQNGNVWTDANAQANATMKQKIVAFNSDEYFDLIRRHPTAAAWLSLGDEVDVVLDDTLYSIRNEAERKS